MRLKLLVLLAVLILPSLGYAQTTHVLASGSSTLSCTNQGGSVGSAAYSVDVYIGVLTSSSTPTLPAYNAGSPSTNCTPRDNIEVWAIQGAAQSYTMVTQAGAGTTLAGLAKSPNVPLALPVSASAADIWLHQIWVWNSTSTEWELVTQVTQPIAAVVSGASAGPGVQVSGTKIGTLNVPTGMINVKTDEGAAGNGRPHFNGAMSVNTNTLSSADFPFASGDVGKLICVAKAAVGGGQLCGTIATVAVGGGSVTVNGFTAGATISGAWFDFWTDDLAAFNNGCTALAVQGGGTLYIPPGDYGLSGQWNCGVNSPIVIEGAARGSVIWGFTGAGWPTTGPALTNTKVGTYITFATTGLGVPALNINRDGIGGPGNGVAANVLSTTIKNLTIWGGVGSNHDGGGNEGIKFTDTPWIRMEDVTVGNFTSNNIETYGGAAQGYLDGLTFDGVWSMISGVDGWVISGESQNVDVRNSQFDNNVGRGIYLNSPIWGFTMHTTNVQRNGAAVEIGINQDIFGCDIGGNYFENNGSYGSTAVTTNSSHWTYCNWGENFSKGADNFMPVYTGSSSLGLNACTTAFAFNSQHMKRCVSDGAGSCTPGNYTPTGSSGTGCMVQCNNAQHWAYTGEQCY